MAEPANTRIDSRPRLRDDAWRSRYVPVPNRGRSVKKNALLLIATLATLACYAAFPQNAVSLNSAHALSDTQCSQLASLKVLATSIELLTHGSLITAAPRIAPSGCLYPTWPKYRGSGDANAADSFSCVAK
jgi:hypothetical protein